MYFDANESDAQKLVKKLGESLQAHNNANPLDYKLAFSAGIVEVDFRKREGLSSLLAQGDELMYKNKKRKMDECG